MAMMPMTTSSSTNVNAIRFTEPEVETILAYAASHPHKGVGKYAQHIAVE